MSNVISCIRYIKDTILKAIYNCRRSQHLYHLLYSVYQRYNFESNLQRFSKFSNPRTCCIRYVKDIILKAIYNQLPLSYDRHGAVFDMSKI